MANNEEQLLQSYQMLVELQQKQVDIARLERFDDQIDQIKQLDQQKLPYKAAINSIRLDSSDYATVTSTYITELTRLVAELQQQNENLQSIMSKWYDEDSDSMKQVNTQRLTLQTYGGVNYSDVISYFIDDKK